MPLSNGCHHVTVITKDIDKFVEFYVSIFDGELQLDLTEGQLRHVMIDLGGFSLHPFQFEGGSPEAAASPNVFSRGHIDHLAIKFDDPEYFKLARKRLVEAGASDGTLTDFGCIRQVRFKDPDGMGCEISIWTDGDPLTLEESREEAFQPRLA